MAIAARRSKPEVSVGGTEKDDFASFVERRRDQAVRLAFRLLGGDEPAAEDVAHNAFLRAHRALPRFRGASSIDTWFYRVLVREVQRHRRWQAVRRLWNADIERTPEPADERPAGDPGLRRRIIAALDHLSRSQREVFVLVHLEDISVTDTAEILGKAGGTVKSHLHRALESLRDDLADLRTLAAESKQAPEGEYRETQG